MTKTATRWLARGTNARRAVEGGLVGLAIGLVIAAIGSTGAFEAYELETIDARLDRFADPERVSKDVVVLKIDDETVRWKESEGETFPFRREIWATLIDMLDSLGPRAIVLDVIFSDRRESGVREVFDESYSSGNVTLGDSAWRSGKVVIGINTIELAMDAPPLLIDDMTGRSAAVDPYLDERLPSVRLVEGASIPEKRALEESKRSHLIRPEEFVLVGARALGFVDTGHVQDPDGTLRRFAPLARVERRIVSDLAIAGLVVAAASTGEQPVWMHPDPPLPGSLLRLPPIEQRASMARLPGDYDVPLRPDGTAWIRWRGRWLKDDALRDRTRNAKPLLANATVAEWEESGRLSANPKLQAEYEEFFRGKIVLVGLTIQGEASDFTQTPFGPQPGVFRYAATLDTILTNEYLRSPTALIDHLLAIVASMLSGIAGFAGADAFRRRSRRPTLIGAGALLPGFAFLAAYFGFAQILFAKGGWIVNVIPALSGISLVTLTCAVTAFALAQRESHDESKRKEHFFNLARQGLGPQVVDQLMKQGPEAIPKAGGQRKHLTLYFSDIAGFTTISEKLEPIQLVEILNEYFERVSRVLVNKHHGYLDKFIGDAVMASWGSFAPDPDGAIRACHAALDARDFIEAFSAELVSRGIPPLKTRIGLNTGTAVAAWVGLPGERWYYTAFGDTVNLASRLEGANKAYGTTVMIGPLTYEEVKGAMVARELDLVRVKGKKIPVRVYELMGRAEDPLPREREIKKRYEAALVKFRARAFAEAGAEFQALIDAFDDSPSKTYRAYCDERIEEPPPPDWDGSNELHEK